MRSFAETLDRIAAAFLFLFVLAVPLSIAATEIAYGVAALAWLARLGLIRKGVLHSSPLNLPILIYWLLCALSASLSPVAGVSWGGMNKVNLIFLVLVVAHNILSIGRARQLVALLLLSGLASVAHTGWQYAVGVGLRVHTPAQDSGFHRAGIRDNDILVRVDGRLIRQPEQFLAHLRSKPTDEPLRLLVIHGEGDAVEHVVPAAALPRPADLSPLGMHLERARPFRAQGFYGHYVTYAEVLQLLAALTFGLWLAEPRRLGPAGLGLAALWLAFATALGATLTRGPWLAAAFACVVQVWFHIRRRWVRVLVPLILLLATVGTEVAMRQWRGVGLIDLREPSTDYRLLMWRDGARLIGEHPWFGVGMERIRLEWWKFDLAAYKKYGFRHHFHSTPIQLAVDLGLPVLAAWVALMGVYWLMLVRLAAQAREQNDSSLYGLALGILGGTSGFLLSSLVHYNFGDSEVVLLFWFLAGLALVLRRQLGTSVVRARL